MRVRLVVAAVALVLVAGCGGGPSKPNPDLKPVIPTSVNPTAITTGSEAVKTENHQRLGAYLVDADGRALYAQDESAAECNAACAAKFWPFFASANGQPPSAEGDVDPDALTVQAPYNHIAYSASYLHYYVEDVPGSTKGQGVGGVWFLMGVDGKLLVG